jgi:hypothetical protein
VAYGKIRIVIGRKPSGGRSYQTTGRHGRAVKVVRSLRQQLDLMPIGTVATVRYDASLFEAKELLETALPKTLVTAINLWKKGKPAEALKTLGPAPVDADSHSLSWRIRFAIDMDDEERAAGCFRQLLSGQGRLDPTDKPPGLLNLFGSLMPQLQQELAPMLVSQLPRMNYQSMEVCRLLDMVPSTLWPDKYLCHRLRTTKTGALIPQWTREATERLEKHRKCLDPAAEDIKQLERALSASAKNVDRHEQGKKKKKVVHPIMRKALWVVPVHVHPEGPIHANGPPPILIGMQREHLANWIRSEAKRLVVGARVDGGRLIRVVTSAFELVAEEASDSKVRTFLLDLDQAMMRIELHTRLERDRNSDLAKTIANRLASSSHNIRFRGADHGDRVQAWLMTIDNNFAMLCYLQGVWTWVEGSCDEVVASMPDQWFEGAVEAVGDL